MMGGIENEGESMPKTRKSHPPSPKAKVAVEAIKAHKTAAQIADVRRPPYPGRRLEETGAGRLAGHLRQRPGADAPAGRYREGRTLQADRPTESGVGRNQARVHMSLGRPGIPAPLRTLTPENTERHRLPYGHVIRSRAVLGGLHHEYWLEKRAA